MDFISDLPSSLGKTVIYVIVDRFSKRCTFHRSQSSLYININSSGFPWYVLQTWRFFTVHCQWWRHYVCQYFWQKLFKLQGCSLNLSSAYRPQSDGQAEVVNRCLETYFRCMISDRPHLWCRLLPLAEYWYDTSYHSSTQTTPLEIFYGHFMDSTTSHLPYVPWESKFQVVARCLRKREKIFVLLKFHLLRA